MRIIPVCTLAWLFAATSAQAVDVGIGARAGINGLGIDLTVGLTKNVNLRFAATSLNIEGEDETIEVGDSGNQGDLDAEVDYDYGVNALLLDWHVFGGAFRFSAGALKNNGKADVSARLQDDIVIDGQPLASNDIRGDIDGELSLGDSLQPYVGIGWGRGAGGGGGFSFMVDLGVALTDPSVEFDARVNSGGDNNLNQRELDRRLRQIEKDAEDDLDSLKVWPVASIGITYAF